MLAVIRASAIRAIALPISPCVTSSTLYCATALYSPKEGAELVCARINGEESCELAVVSEWTLDPGVEAINQGLEPFIVHMLRDGTTEKVWMDENDFEYTLNDQPTIWRRSEAPAYQGKNIPDCLMARVFAKDSQHAVKIANEHRTRMIASGEWK